MSRIQEAQDVLRQLGMPRAQQNEISALTLLALCGLKEADPWARASRRSLTIRKGIMEFVNQNYRVCPPIARTTTTR